MLTTRRRERRSHRRARFHLESLDDRLVLSAASAAVAALHHEVRREQRLEARLAGMEARHGPHATRAESHLAARIARLDARIALLEANISSSGPLPGNVASALQSLYREYESQGGGSHFTPGLPSDRLLLISGTSVAVSFKIGAGSDFNTALSQLQSDGLQVIDSSSKYSLIEGMLPIAELPAAAQVAASVTPAPPPVTR